MKSTKKVAATQIMQKNIRVLPSTVAYNLSLPRSRWLAEEAGLVQGTWYGHKRGENEEA
jgi:hypothetical protein